MTDNHPSAFTPLEGCCTCRKIRYRLEHQPMIVHCCFSRLDSHRGMAALIQKAD